MQPYLYPYAGYFRLFAVADVFVVLDDVQFPRRGRVHRCQIPGPAGAPEWLTLPLARAARGARIEELRFAARARDALDRRLARHRWIGAGRGELAERVREHLGGPLDMPAAFLERGLHLVRDALDLRARIVRASDLAIAPGLQAQDHILALATAAGAATYVNAPGGRALYHPPAFADAGIALRFLAPYEGRFTYMLPALMGEDAGALRDDVCSQLDLTE
jgi:hypothetical protein